MAHSGRHDDIRDYPHLTAEEFDLACHFFVRAFLTASLKTERKTFKLDIITNFASEDASYMVVTRALHDQREQMRTLELDLEAMCRSRSDLLHEENMDDSNSMDLDAATGDEDDSVSPFPCDTNSAIASSLHLGFSGRSHIKSGDACLNQAQEWNMSHTRNLLVWIYNSDTLIQLRGDSPRNPSCARISS